MIRVLIADDHNGMRRAFAMALVLHEGVQMVDEVPDGASAVARLGQGGVDVALIDMEMPGMKGDEVIRAVLAGDGFKPRMVIYSGFIAPDLVRRALDAGACGYLGKDAGIVETVKVIKAVARGEVCLCPAALAMVGEDAVDEAVRKMSERAFRVSAEEIVEEYVDRALLREGHSWPWDVEAYYRAICSSFTDANISLNQTRRRCGLHDKNLSTKFRLFVGSTPSSLVASLRIGLARDLLASTDLEISDIAFRVGYASVSAFSTAFRSRCGASASATRVTQRADRRPTTR